MAALFTAQQAPGFPAYTSFSSLHCAVWKSQVEKEACFETSFLPPKKAVNEHLISNGSFVDSEELWKNKFVLYLPLAMGRLRGKMDIRRELSITCTISFMLLQYRGKKEN